MCELIVTEATAKLLAFIEAETFKGYDPYDFLNSPVPFRYLGHMAQAVVVQAGKLLPFNMRPLLCVKKEFNPKGLGLLLSAYCNLYKKTEDKKYLETAGQLYNTLKECRSRGYEEYCWGYNFVWANPHSVHPKYMPSSVVTSFVCQGIFDYYNICGSQDAIDVIRSASQYVLKYLRRTETHEGICLSYTEEEQNCCYNASLLSGELLSIQYAISKDDNLLGLIQKIVAFVLYHQHSDGHWGYSIDLATGKEHQQVDFHQGFILCSLYRIYKNIGDMPLEVEQAIKKGMVYYMEKQFLDNGRSLWRLPKEFPIDIHNQAQGIITFSLLSDYCDNAADFAKTIAKWTIKNMQSDKGFFYYRIYKHYVNRIPFMRWSQSWMLLALTDLYALD